jgi:secondary thiamine-phosphate synthase enzyme
MSSFQTRIEIGTKDRGLVAITREIEEALTEQSGVSGVLNIFIQHTSASLLIQENTDPSAKRDLEEFIDRLVPENQTWHRHLDEGADDTVSHMKSSITATSLSVPFSRGRLLLGTWQGIYVWEHRRAPHRRTVVLTLLY